MDRFVGRALVLSTVDYGDADRLVTLFTEERGKLTAFAAGARKSKRRFAGALESGTLLKAQLVERNGTTFRLDGVDIEQSFLGVRGDLARLARALYAMELLRELTRDREAFPQLFSLAVSYLTALDQHQAGPTSLIAFELDGLACTGLMPRFDRCAICEQALTGEVQFDAEHGGTVCGKCSARVHTGRPIPLELARLLRVIQEGGRTPLGPELRRRAREILDQFIAHHLGRRLKSVQFLEQLGVD